MQQVLAQGAKYIKEAKALILTAGAGMGVDSGLPDFRGDQGFWRAYPLYQQLGLSFVDAANPARFAQDPSFAWGFYGHRLGLYRQCRPHAGFALILQWAARFGQEIFVVTSNVDGQFQQAGYDEAKIYEVHGSIHHLQCLRNCRPEIWENSETPVVDLTQMKAKTYPCCKFCGRVARPNILMFGDAAWQGARSAAQETRFHQFLSRHQPHSRLVIEIGAGQAVPTIRRLSQGLGREGARVMRINPREAEITAPHLSLPLGGLEGLTRLDQAL